MNMKLAERLQELLEDLADGKLDSTVEIDALWQEHLRPKLVSLLEQQADTEDERKQIAEYAKILKSLIAIINLKGIV